MATIFGERELIERELVNIIQPDTGRGRPSHPDEEDRRHGGGPPHHDGAATPARSARLPEYAALHLLAAIPNGLILERLDDDWPGRASTIVPHPQQQVDGFITVPDAPGLGCDIDEAFVAKHPSHPQRLDPGEGRRAAASYAPGTFGEHVYVQTRLGRGTYFPKG